MIALVLKIDALSNFITVSYNIKLKEPNHQTLSMHFKEEFKNCQKECYQFSIERQEYKSDFDISYNLKVLKCVGIPQN